jgi:hypothetical protein
MSEAGLSTLFWSTPRVDAKYLSNFAIIDLIHFTLDDISHIELSRQINLLRPAIVNDLPAIGLVNEVEDCNHPL